MVTTAHDASASAPDWDPSEENFAEGVRTPEYIGEVSRLRQECPVAHSDHFGGFYSLTRYEDVAKAALDFKTYTSRRQFTRLPALIGIIPGSLNPPEHGIYRKMLNTYFSKERMDAMAPLLRQYAIEQLTPMIERGRGDIGREFCQPFPARALAALLDLGDEAYHELLKQFKQFEAVNWEPEKVNNLIFILFSEHIVRVMAERRANDTVNPENDLISGAMAMEVDGQPLSDETIINIGVTLIGAGHATTADALSTAIYRIATDPYLQARLRREPHLIPQAIEEFLRLEAPVPEMSRDAAQDVELHGTTIPEGSLVALNFGSANLDPDVFEHPESCIIERSPNRHLAFGHGAHKCAGAPMARIELVAAIEELLSRTKSFELDGVAERAPGLLLNGFASLPMRFAAR